MKKILIISLSLLVSIALIMCKSKDNPDTNSDGCYSSSTTPETTTTTSGHFTIETGPDTGTAIQVVWRLL